ncbi:MAG: ABC transporter substrate-binding protein, partial [Lachnospiraceae bacterium]|nr:ABC transporter substrate-binding protein [Lachnospiraceae bacterium]
MKKKVLSVLLSSAMVATIFAGCGGAAADTATQEPAPAEEATTEEAAPAEEAPAEEAATEETAASGDVISIGFAQVGHESDWRTAS